MSASTIKLTSTLDMMPVTRGMGGAPASRGIVASDPFGCSLCHTACNAISDPRLRAACHVACDISGVCP